MSTRRSIGLMTAKGDDVSSDAAKCLCGESESVCMATICAKKLAPFRNVVTRTDGTGFGYDPFIRNDPDERVEPKTDVTDEMGEGKVEVVARAIARPSLLARKLWPIGTPREEIDAWVEKRVASLWADYLPHANAALAAAEGSDEAVAAVLAVLIERRHEAPSADLARAVLKAALR